MTADELKRTGKRMYGDRGWQRKLAAALDIDTSTLRRWIAERRVPRIASLAMETLVERHKKALVKRAEASVS